jgi:tetratricopeptide (TPR) repeat protein
MTPEDHSGGPVRCEQLGPFVDGELSSEDSAAFRRHLLVCARCQQEMHGLMQLSALAEQAREQRRAPAPELAPAVIAATTKRAHPRRAAWMAVVGGVAIAAALVLALRVNASRTQLPTLLASLEARRTSGWPSYAGAREYRPYVVQRGTSAPVPLKGLARLEEDGNWQALGTAALVQGEYAQALGYLRRAPRNVASLNDVGLALMDSGNLEAALEAFDQARELDPAFAPVEFNRGLALERLGLPRAGLQSMREASQVALGGWKDEAVRTVAALERTVQVRTAGSEQLEAARHALLDGTLPDPQLVRSYPGTFRFQLYTALALAPDRTAVEKLLSLARQLDGIGGGHRLEEWVTRTAARSNARRAALAPRLRDFTATSLPALRDTLLSEADAAGQDDQALYILSREFPPRDAKLARLVERLHDPFWDLRLLTSRVRVQRDAGHPAEAERLARSISDGACRDDTLSGECWNVSYELAQTYAYAGRPADAQRVFETSRAEAEKAPHPVRDRGLLLHAGATNADADRVALARAQFDEADHLSSADCATREYSALSLAQAYVRRGDVRATRATLGSIPACEHPNLGLQAEIEADLAVLSGSSEDRTHARERLEKATAAATAPVERLTVDALRVMLDAEDGRQGTLSRFQELLARERQITGADDQIARAGRSVGLQLLRDSRGKDALALAAQMLATSVPESCALAVIADGRRIGFATLGRAGAVSQQVQTRLEGGPPGAPPALDPGLPGDQRARSHRVPRSAAVAPGGPGMEPPGWPVAAGGSFPVRGAPAGPRCARAGGSPAAAARRACGVRAGLGHPRGPRGDALAGPGAAGGRGPGGLRGARDRGRCDSRWSGARPEPRPERDLLALRLRHPRPSPQRAPVVLLGACRAATGSHYRDATWSLPQAFVQAGARAVIASLAELPDDRVGRFLSAVARRVESGAAPSVALRDERVEWLRRGERWSQEIVLFD